MWVKCCRCAAAVELCNCKGTVTRQPGPEAESRQIEQVLRDLMRSLDERPAFSTVFTAKLCAEFMAAEELITRLDKREAT